MYTVNILPSAEFDKLPYKHVKTSLGCADAKTGTAYVRDTGHNDITKATIAHELDELIANVSPHEEDGIRYKNLANTFSGFGNAVGSVAKPIGSAIKSVAGGIGNLFSGGGSGAPSNLNQPGGAFGKFSAPTPSGAKSITIPGVGQAPFPTPLAQTTSSGGSGGAFGNFLSGIINPSEDSSTLQKMVGPAAISALGNFFAPKVETPDFSGISSDLRNQITGASGQSSEAKDLGMTEMRRILQTPLDTPPETAFTAGDLALDEQLKKDTDDLIRRFKAVRPGVDIANDSDFRDALIDLQDRARAQRTASRDEQSFAYEREQLTNKYNTMVQALNLDQSQLNQLINLAQLDIAQIMIQTGVSQAEAAQVKQLFGDLGSLVGQSNLGLV